MVLNKGYIKFARSLSMNKPFSLETKRLSYKPKLIKCNQTIRIDYFTMDFVMRPIKLEIKEEQFKQDAKIFFINNEYQIGFEKNRIHATGSLRNILHSGKINRTSRR